MVLIYGWGSKAKPLGLTPARDCLRCSNYGPRLVYETKKRFKLYGIPVAQWNKKYIIECAICPDTEVVSGAEAARLIAEGERSHRKDLLKAVAAVLKAGAAVGGPGSAEWAYATSYLSAFAEEDSLSASQVDQLLQDARLEDINNRLLDEEQRLVILRLAVEVALADGELQSAELKSVEALADRLGVDRRILEALISLLTGGQFSRSSDRQSACEILGVAVDASVADIRVAYRRLIVIHHPDSAAPGDRDNATQKAAQINAAYDYLLGKADSMPA